MFSLTLSAEHLRDRGAHSRIAHAHLPPLPRFFLPNTTQEVLKPRTTLPPLLINLSDRRPEKVHWLGAAFGLTQELLNFWSRLGFKPVYLRQTPSDVTGECSTIVLRALSGAEEADGGAGWAEAFAKDFRVRCSPTQQATPRSGLLLPHSCRFPGTSLTHCSHRRRRAFPHTP